jgi:hypothetical protein
VIIENKEDRVMKLSSRNARKASKMNALIHYELMMSASIEDSFLLED